MLDVKEIFKYIPHRYPFLLVDRILEVEGMAIWRSNTPILILSCAQPGEPKSNKINTANIFFTYTSELIRFRKADA